MLPGRFKVGIEQTMSFLNPGLTTVLKMYIAQNVGFKNQFNKLVQKVIVSAFLKPFITGFLVFRKTVPYYMIIIIHCFTSDNYRTVGRHIYY